MKGCFITVEGMDGAGKTTALDFLASEITEAGRDVVIVPGIAATAAGAKIREILLNMPIDPVTELSLFFAARVEQVKQCIQPALAENKVVICDRFTDCTYAYQGFGLRRFTYVSNLDRVLMENFTPHLTLWMDTVHETMVKRLQNRPNQDLIEKRDINFFNRVRNGYKSIYASNRQRVTRVDANRDLPFVQEEMRHWLINAVYPYLERNVVYPVHVDEPTLNMKPKEFSLLNPPAEPLTNWSPGDRVYGAGSGVQHPTHLV